jgi:8-oxo-dGTP diphosphatase
MLGRSPKRMNDQAPPRPVLRVTAAVIERDGKVLVARRGPGQRFAGLWEFPGGKLEEGEDPVRCLERELREELGIRARVGRFLCAVPYRSPALALDLLVYRADQVAGRLRPVDHDDVRWLDPAEMDEAAFTEPDRPVIRMLRQKGAGP